MGGGGRNFADHRGKEFTDAFEVFLRSAMQDPNHLVGSSIEE